MNAAERELKDRAHMGYRASGYVARQVVSSLGAGFVSRPMTFAVAGLVGYDVSQVGGTSATLRVLCDPEATEFQMHVFDECGVTDGEARLRGVSWEVALGTALALSWPVMVPTASR